MAGLSDYTAQNIANWLLGDRSPPLVTSVFLGLFTTMPSDAGSGGVEVSGGAYARQQVYGVLQLSGSFTTASTTLTLASTAPAWLLALGVNGSGVNVYDSSNSQQIGTVLSISGTTVTLTGAAAHASSGASDFLVFSAFPAASASSGAEPATTPVQVSNGAAINFPPATASWGTVVGVGFFDASSSGNLLLFDYLGAGPWQPATMTAASPGVITCHAHGFTTASLLEVSAKFSGSLPTFGQSNLTGVLVPVSPTTDTFTVTNGGTAVNTSASGDFNVRAVVQQSIPSGVTFSCAAGQLTVSFA